MRTASIVQNEYDVVSIVTAVLDLLLALIAGIQLIRILISERRQALAMNSPSGNLGVSSPSFRGSNYSKSSHGTVEEGNHADAGNHAGAKWSGKKLFHVIILACMLVRGSFQAANPFYVHDPEFMSEGIWLIWMELGSALFLLAYFMLLLYWADFYYRVQQTSPPRRWMDRLKGPIFGLLSCMAVAFIVFAAIFIPQKELAKATMLDNVAESVMSVLSVGVAVGFLYFGIRLWLVLRHYRIISVRKRNQTRKVVGVACITTMCFATRAVLIGWSVTLALTRPDTRQWNTPWELVAFFFLGLETFPVALMLFLLRKLPNWKLDAERRGLIGGNSYAGHAYSAPITPDRGAMRYGSYSTGLYSSKTHSTYAPVQ